MRPVMNGIARELERYPLTGRFLMHRLRHALSDHEKELLESLIDRTETYDRPKRLIARGQVCNHSTMLIEGFMVRTIHEHDKRYVVGVQVPGDFVDLHAFALKRLDHDLVTIGPTKVGFVPHDAIERVMEREPHLARLFWFSTLMDAAVHREWILKLEQLKAERRVAHLLCELWKRLEFVGLARPNGFRSPLTQADLADSCGTTAIHMNRTLAELKRQGLAEFRRGTLIAPDRKKLEKHADFDPTYLYGVGDLYIGSELTRD